MGEEFEVAKRKLVEEINLLTRKLADSESKLKVEVEGIKKKMAITITELEMALDASNKSNGQLQMTAKGQAEKLMQLTAAYDDVSKKLTGSVQQYDITVKRLTQIETELKTVTVNYNNTVKVVKDYEGKMALLSKQVAELTSANTNLSQVKVKVEKDLAAVTRDYNDIARELKLADDRANKAAGDAGHFESLLREEQTKLMKIASDKKALENEVRTLSVRIEEIETNSVATSKRTIQKMEIRITELEEMINVEKKSHAATMTELQTKTRQIKELVLQSEEDRKNIIILQESLDKLNEKIKMYKRQLEEQEGISNANIMRVKKFQRELECAENRAEEAESTLNQFRSRERVFAAASVRNEKSKTSRRPRSSSRRPSTRSMLAPPPQAPPWSPPAPPSRPPETSALAPPSAELALLPELVQSPEQGQHSDQDLSFPPGINQPPSHHLPLYIQTVCAVNM